MAKKWTNADEADQQIKMLARLLDPTDKIAAPTTGAMIGAMMIATMIGATTTVITATTIEIGVGKMTLGGDKATTDQLTTPSMLSSQRLSATTRMPTPRSFRVLAQPIQTPAIQ
jgi:hypothetical protein